MKLDRLRYFVAVAEEGHFGRAAERLHVSQPALSQQVRSLEDELGVTLFDRAGRRHSLSAAGRELLRDARAVLALGQRAGERARQAADGAVGRLSIGYTSDYNEGPLPAALARFHAAHPQVAVESRLGTSLELAEAVRDRLLDVAFLVPPMSAPVGEIALHPLPPVRFGAVLPRSHRFAGRGRIELARLAEERFVLPPVVAWTGFYWQLARLFEEAGFQPDLAHEVLDPTMLGALVASGVGVGLASSGSFSSADTFAFVPLIGEHAVIERAAACRTGAPPPLLAGLLALLPSR